MTQETPLGVLNVPDDYRLVEPDGTVTIFDGTDKLIKSQTTPGGQVTEFLRSTTTTVPRIGEMRRTFEYGTNQETIESRWFQYDGDNVQYITLRRATDSTSPDWTDIRRVELVYYTSDVAGKGNIGDLKLIKQQLPGGTPGTWVDDKVQMFRYYTSGESSHGFQHGLKYVLSPEGYERMSDPEGSSNAQLAPFASAFYEYDSAQRVKTVSTEGGQVTNTIVWTENNLTDFAFNNWLRKAVIAMPDGLEKTVYSNHIGQDLLVDDKDGSDHWITNWKYNSEGRLEHIVHPSAIDMSGTPYNEASDNLSVQVKTDAGLIEVFTYNTSAAVGYPEFRKVKKGSNGTPINVNKTDYFSRSIGVDPDPITAISLVDEITVYRSDSGTGDSVTTLIEYTWFTDTVQVKTATTNLPAVPVPENGFNVVDTIVREFDIQGRLIKVTDARGIVTIYVYDEVTGSQIQMVQDAGAGGLLLTTDMTNDDLGRMTETLGPEHNVDGQTIRSATWTVYREDIDEVWIGRGYKTGSSYTLINPVRIQKLDQNGRVVDSIQATRGSGVESSGKLTESDSFPRSSWVRWNRNEYGDGGRMESTFVYHAIPPFGSGSATFYDETKFGYDSIGRQNMVKSPAGTITRSVIDVRSQVVSVWVGTNDTGATDSDPTGGGAAGNNMKAVTLNEYDDGLDGGDGNLTKSTRPVDDTSSNDRITEMEFDWRDRQINTIIDDGTNKFQTISTLDNLGRTTVSETKRGISSPVLIAKSETKFDTRGRIYRTLLYAVNDSGVAGNDLESNTWFDANNNVIKSQPAGSAAFTKMTYDAINRPISSYYGHYAGTGTDDPETLVDNLIFTESTNVYDAASNTIQVTSKARNHNATGTGALNGPAGSQPKSRDSYVFNWFDAIGRATESANYGTNGGTVPSRAASPPASSDTILVSKSVYNADGEIEDVVDPLGKIDRTEFDAAGRTTKVTLNHDGTDTEVTRIEYSLGRMSKQIAENSTTGNQQTTYGYGVTLTNSNIASNDLLQTMNYPDAGAVSYEYNRQSQQNEMTDQNQTVHAYDFDKLGRTTSDRVTLAGGSAVDNSILRIATSYDNRLRMEKVTSYDAATGGSVVNEVLHQYNDFNQLINEYQQHGSAVNTSTSPKVEYGYENGSANNVRQKSVTYPTSSRVLNYDYGTAGGENDKLSRIEKLKIGTTVIVDYDYLGMNRIAIQKYTEPNPDLIATIVTGSGNDLYPALDRFDRVVNLVWERGSRRLIDYDYTYDRVGNKTTQKVNDSPAPANVDEFYGYDQLYRLKEYDRGQLVSGSITNPVLTQDWTLDQTGNWNNFQQGVVGALNQNRTHNTVNEITNIAKTVGDVWPTPAYDANGNMTEFPQPDDLTSSFDATWDAWNRLVKLDDGSETIAAYGYDGLNRRIIKKKFVSGSLSETRHCYYSSSAQCLEERIDTSSNAAQQFIWGIRYIDDLILRDRDTNGDGTLDERLYAFCDSRFSILAITDEAGAVQERYSYDGYGKTRIYTPAFAARTTSSFAWEFRYTGRRQDLETGIYFFRARYYHAELGRFISRDPIGYVDGMSLYRSYFVPRGLDPTGSTRCRCESNSGGTVTVFYQNVLNGTDCSSLNSDFEGGFVNCFEHSGPIVPRPVIEPPGVMPLPSDTPSCDLYPDDYTYFGTNAKCFCKCAGNSDWSQYVRGCLWELYNQTPPVSANDAHVRCYLEATFQEGLLPPFGILAVCFERCKECGTFPGVGPGVGNAGVID